MRIYLLSSSRLYKILKVGDNVFFFFLQLLAKYGANNRHSEALNNWLIDWLVDRPWLLSSLLQVCGEPTSYHSRRLYRYHGRTCWSGGCQAQSTISGLHWPQTGSTAILGTLHSNPVSSSRPWKMGWSPKSYPHHRWSYQEAHDD